MGSISGSGATYTATITPNGNGNVALNIAAGVAQDAASNTNTAAIQVTVTQTDDVGPTVVIATDSGGSFNESAPGSFTATITFSESVTGFTDGDLTATNGTVGSISGSGTTYTATITPNGNGNVALNVAAGVAQDAATNTNTAATQVTVTQTDDVAPTVAISTGSTTSFNQSSLGSFTATITFSESVTGFTDGDLTATNATVGSISGSGTTYTATITPNGNGNVDLNVAAGVAQDAASNTNTAATQVTVTQTDDVAPTVAITTGGTTSFNQSAPGSFTATITFSESVTGFTDGDLTATNATVGSISGSGTTYTATITPNGNGNVDLNVAAGVAQDAASNTNVVAPQVTVTQTDDIAPTAQILGAPSIHDGATPFNVTIEFSEDVTAFVQGDVTVNGGATITNLTPVDASTYTAQITPNATTAITIEVAAGVAQDGAGNGNIAAVQVSISGDTTTPTPTITTSSSSHDGSSAFTATVTFDEPVNGFLPSELTATNATVAGAFTTGADGDAVYTIEVTPTGPQDVVLSIAAAVAKDAAGNDNVAAADVTVTGTVVQITKERITSFLTNRANHILNNQPNLTGFITGQNTSGGGPLGYLAINGNEGSQNVRFANLALEDFGGPRWRKFGGNIADLSNRAAAHRCRLRPAGNHRFGKEC